MYTKVDLALTIMLINSGSVLRKTLHRAGALENWNTRGERRMKREELVHAYKYNGDNIIPAPFGRVRKGEVIYVLTDFGVLRLIELGFKIKFVQNNQDGTGIFKHNNQLMQVDKCLTRRSSRCIYITENQLH